MFVTTIFLVLALIGFILLIVSLVFGHGDDVDATPEIEGGGPSFFSFRSLAVFLATFGAVGATANYLFKNENKAFLSSLLGVMGGIIMSGVYLLAMRAIYSQQASSLVTDRDLVGTEGRVTVAIPENGMGEVSCVVGTQTSRRMARAQRAISEGAMVRIKEVHGDTVVVELLTEQKI